MTFNVAADAYGKFMGQYSEPLAVPFADAAGVRAGQRALDVGCGPGALTAQLVERLGADAVSAIDPSPPFVAAMRERFPAVDVHAGVAEMLPFPDDDFDLALAQLVVHFMDDPVAGLREMARVTRPGGSIAACVWDHAGGGGPSRRSGRRRATSIRTCTTSPAWPVPGRATWPSCATAREYGTSSPGC